ncbi:uncharacterized protein MEPE_00308 [Melanopsichium pennsylvanicum]|uniref:CTLH domain-containing protein n=2 Tax=Melanopsichium pennsylvanicum TaxID=63383 RepID=A0AAJ4XGB4_9BASI|nr:motif-containing protein [Melanopsichium pennsylvanicum 4]SNX81603.1 uncharacterized protein MEPE_00308 [Melanopsichium pennsylvanicum]
MQSSNNTPSSTSYSHTTYSASCDDNDLTSPANLRKLVLNYLLHHCYTDTAIAFAKDGIIGDLYGAEHANIVTTSSHTPGSTSTSTTAAASNTTPSISRASNRTAPAYRQAHPLSAPPLSRDDSSMEIEVENLLPTTSEQSDPSHEQAASNAYSIGYSNGHSDPRSPSRSDQDHDRQDMEQAQLPDLDSDYDQVADELDHDVDISPNLTAQDLTAVKARKQIKDCIVSGQIRQAMDLINTHFPTVLNSAASTSGAGSSAASSKSSRTKESGSSGGTSSKTLQKLLPANPTSMEPDHLLLNLQIQVFIEAIRSASNSQLAHSSTSSLTSGLPLLASTTPGIANSISRAASPAPSATSSNGSATSTTGNGAALNPVLHSALAYAQGLYASAQKLPSFWRAMYLKELEQVTALLAYTDVEHSPVRRFLHKSRKLALAEQVNSAILYRSGKPSQPLVELAVRQTTLLWDQLQAEEVQVGTAHPVWGLVTAGGAGYQDMTASQGAGKKHKDTRKLPPWKFRTFLQER